MSKSVQGVTITAKIFLPAPDRVSMRAALDLADSIETAVKAFPGVVTERFDAVTGKRQMNGAAEAAQAEPATQPAAEPQVPLASDDLNPPSFLDKSKAKT